MTSPKLIQKMDFSGHNVYVGLDVHKKNWNVSIYVGKHYFKSFQQAPSPDQLEKYLNENYPGANTLCGYEAGFCGFWIQRDLSDRGIRCIVINPADVPITDKEKQNKTDKIDSKRIASSLDNGKLQAIYIPSKRLEADRRLVRFRKSVLNDLTRSKNRIKSELHLIGMEIPPKYRGWSKSFIVWLKGLPMEHKNLRITLDQAINRMEQLRDQLLLLNRALRNMIKEEPYQKIGELLIKITGIGLITAVTLLTEIGEIERFESFDRLNSFIGFCPTEHSSGESERKGKITPRGHRELRGYLVEAAWTATRTDPALAACYAELTKRMMGKKAITRIARKVLRRVYSVWKHKMEYQNGIN